MSGSVHYSINQVTTLQTNSGQILPSDEGGNGMGIVGEAATNLTTGQYLMFELIPDAGWYVEPDMFTLKGTSGSTIWQNMNQQDIMGYRWTNQVVNETILFPDYIDQVMIFRGSWDGGLSAVNSSDNDVQFEIQDYQGNNYTSRVFVKVIFTDTFIVPAEWQPEFTLVLDIDGDALEIPVEENNVINEGELSSSFNLEIEMANGADSNCRVVFLPGRGDQWWTGMPEGFFCASYNLCNSGTYNFNLNNDTNTSWRRRVTFKRPAGAPDNIPIQAMEGSAYGLAAASYSPQTSGEAWFWIVPNPGYTLNSNCLSVKQYGNTNSVEPSVFGNRIDQDQDTTHTSVVPLWSGGSSPDNGWGYDPAAGEVMPSTPAMFKQQMWFRGDLISPMAGETNGIEDPVTWDPNTTPSTSASMQYYTWLNQSGNSVQYLMNNFFEELTDFNLWSDYGGIISYTHINNYYGPAIEVKAFGNDWMPYNYNNLNGILASSTPEERIWEGCGFTCFGSAAHSSHINNSGIYFFNTNQLFTKSTSDLLDDTFNNLTDWNDWSVSAWSGSFADIDGDGAYSSTAFDKWRYPWDWWENDEGGDPFPYGKDTAKIPAPYCASDYQGNAVGMVLAGFSRHIPGAQPSDIKIKIYGSAMPNDSNQECVDYDVEITF